MSSMHRRVLVATAFAAACARPQPIDVRSAWAVSLAPSASGPDGAHVPYDFAVMKAVHNAYDRHEPIFDQLVYHRVRSVEIDVHASRGGAQAAAGDWWVYHADMPTLRGTSCARLSDCLGQVAAFHRAVPEHEIVSVFVDLKEDLGEGHRAADLDAALARHLGREALMTPADLVAACPSARTIRDAVSGACRFPTLARLRGKILVAITGGSLCDRGSRASVYAGDDAARRLAFVAPDLDDACPIEAYDTRREAIFLNMRYDERRRAAGVRARGLVARIYKGGFSGGLDSEADFAHARAAGAQQLATDAVNADVDPWSTTSSPRGWPFWCPGCDGTLAEPGALTTVRARSGDIGGARDSFYWAYEEDASAATWSAFVSVPSSHVEAAAKACLMARASDAADAPNVSLCRPLDRGAPRLQVRSFRGGITRVVEMAPPAGVTAESVAFLRLAIAPAEGSGATDVFAEGSIDGLAWTPIARATVSVPLPLRGIAVASRGRDAVRAIFGALERTKDGARAVYGASSFPKRGAIGAGADGSASEGVDR